MATVYLARDLTTDQLVAIKVLLPDLGLVVGPDRFRREIDLASRFSHPYILPVSDSGETDGLLYYVMPYVAGESLRSRLDREGQLPVDDAIQIACEVAGALDYAHDHGVIHRDIKPENILLEDGHALVADFGIARAVADAGEERLTQTGVTLGTPRYMSPEQAAADRNIDGRSDLYALGCVLYEMLAGQPPFIGPNAQAIIARHALDQAPLLTIVRPTIPLALEAVVLRSLAKVPADRFQTGAAFAAALRSPPADALTWRTSQRTSAFAGAAPPLSPRARLAQRAPLAAAAALLLAAGGWAAWRHSHRSHLADASSGLDPRHIAVLYFTDASPAHDLGSVADGLTDALIGQLGDVPSLSVISPGGVAPYRTDTTRPAAIARTLQVGTLVRGTVDHDGDQLRVKVQLVDGASGADDQHATFRQPAAKVLALRDTLASEVAQMIRSRLGETIKLREQRAGATSAEAWTLLQQAQRAQRLAEERMQRSGDTAALLRDFHAADSLAARADTLDPAWADPSILRGAIAYRLSRFFGNDPSRTAAWIDSGFLYVGRALTIAPKNTDALELRGTLRYWSWLSNSEPDPAKAKALLTDAQQDLETATKLNPGQAGAWSVLASLYYGVDDVVAAKLAARRAYEQDAYLNNADIVLWRLFTTSYDLEQFPEADHWCQTLGQRFPAYPRSAECRLYVLGTRLNPPDVPRAWRLADSLVTLSPPSDRVYAKLNGQVMAAAVLARAGMADSARHVVNGIPSAVDVDPTHDIDESKAYVWVILGDKTQAVRNLKVYFAANPGAAPNADQPDDWRWRSLQDDPRYQALKVHTAPAR
jgi:serine/threonine-protein kinase